ncbi:hypothetical protein FZI85_27475 [Mycobacterium sp. CBMA293]|uniref:ESX-1 secretion-associated protein n=1 Tax=Mycolicibacterium sp. CBMA 213 TaxID=1968788 RepID=A0A1S6GKP3_9MYCO|nr:MULTISPECIES: type VII secretion target [unclassified Mycolicibacterium]AQS22435.1 hypothetical protein pCBMA213_2_00071 [Mycolicibacterium sp. CBMA 213]MUL48337.1 hypothetical protein [Mycolicibacterium sp. CBMA 360]MUL62348.1 hypothetical protein [Mycolicibacterium sp. CBMA 335]MUM04486.1 hypothetical protein [Mycolicibacterium sp. CBMA 213]MUM14748.1 hypothetical protein [Mycolicibacterium sp. CBMA 293]
MTEPLKLTPSVLREVAEGHGDVANLVDTAREAGGDILAAVESFGPLFHGVKAAVGDIVADRSEKLGTHAARHRLAADELHKSAHRMINTDDDQAANLRNVEQA